MPRADAVEQIVDSLNSEITSNSNFETKYEIKTNYGIPIESTELEDVFNDSDDFKMYLRLNGNDTSDKVSVSTYGAIAMFTGFLMCFSRSPKLAVSKVVELINNTGFEKSTNLGSYSRRSLAPYKLGALNYWALIPFPSIRLFAKRYDNTTYWLDQLIKIQVQLQE